MSKIKINGKHTGRPPKLTQYFKIKNWFPWFKNQAYGPIMIVNAFYSIQIAYMLLWVKIAEKSNCMNSQFSETRASTGNDMKFWLKV